jgi:hypothetical protein
LFLANFALPSNEVEEGETPLFSEIIFSDLDREEAQKVVDEYNKVNINQTLTRWGEIRLNHRYITCDSYKHNTISEACQTTKR